MYIRMQYKNTQYTKVQLANFESETCNHTLIHK